MFPWPNCKDCAEPMLWLADSKIVSVHICRGCGKLVVAKNGHLEWFRRVTNLQELLTRFPHLERFREIHNKAKAREKRKGGSSFVKKRM